MVRLALRVAAHEVIPPLWVVASFAFVPYDIGDVLLGPGQVLIQPVLGPGWTLQYEMLFYVIFAVSLLFRPGLGIAVQTAGILLCFVGGMIFQHNTWIEFSSQAGVFLFLSGSFLNLLFRRQSARFPSWLLPIGVASGTLMTAVTGIVYPAIASTNLFHFTVAGLIVGGSVFARNVSPMGPALRFIHRIGDASYSLYLSHTIVLFFIRSSIKRIAPAQSDILVPLIGIPLGIIVGILVWRYVETPLLTYTRLKIGVRPD